MSNLQESKLIFTASAIYFLLGLYFDNYLTTVLGVVLMALWSDNIYLDHRLKVLRSIK